MNKYLEKLAAKVYLKPGGKEKYEMTFIRRLNKTHKRSMVGTLYDAFKEPSIAEGLKFGKEQFHAGRAFKRLQKRNS